MVDETFSSVQTDKLNTPLLLKTAKILLVGGDVKLAKNIFRTLIENGEVLGIAYAGLAATFELEKKYDLAIKAYREAIIYEPTFGSLNALAELYVLKEDFRNAVGTLLRILNLPKIKTEQVFEVQKHLGNCYIHMNQMDHAEQHYRTAYEINPQSDQLHTNIGSLALQKGDSATALLHFKEAVRINCKNDKAFTGIGLAYLAQGNKALAFEAFLTASTVEISNVTALFNLVKCAYEIKQFKEVSEQLKMFIDLHPVNSNILYSYAGVLFHQKKLGAAKEECEKLLQLNADHKGAQKLLEIIQKEGQQN